MATFETLTKGNVLLTSAKKVNGGKIQLEFAEHVNNPNLSGNNNIVGLLNASDSRFGASKPRRAWVSAEIADAVAMIDQLEADQVASLANAPVGEEMELNISNPSIQGQDLHVQVNETIAGTKWQMENIDRAAKRRGADGDIMTYNGSPIFSDVTVVAGEAKHTFLQADPVKAEVPVGESMA